MSYPERLIPREEFCIIDFDRANTRTKYLIRHTDIVDISNKEGKLKGELVSTDDNYNHLRDFSTNLLGVFQLEDIQWVWAKGTPCLGTWHPGEEGIFPSNKDVVLGAGRGCFYLSIFVFHHKRFFTLSEQEGESEVECKLLHTPLMSNFWHCSLRWYCDGEDSESWNKGRMRRMKAHIRDFILEKAQLEEPIYQAIDPFHYTI